MGYYNDEDADENNDHAIAMALRQSRFPSMPHAEVRVGNWLYQQFDKACERQQSIGRQLDVDMLDEVGVWKVLAADAFAACRSAAAKRVMWSAIAMTSRQFDEAPMIQAIAPFLREHSQWQPKDAKAKNIECFAGIYTPGKYTLAPLLTAAQQLDIDPRAQAFVQEWLAHLALAPGVLPVQKYRAQRDATAEEDMRQNAVLWRCVVVPFMKRNPENPLFGGRMFFHLPINPNEHAAKELLQSLDSPAQRQSVYANMLCHRQPTSIVKGIWEEAQAEELTAEQKDLRLHLAMLHVDGHNARTLANRVDAASVAMLESLASFTPGDMAKLTYTRWFDRPQQRVELPADWFDPETMGL